MTLTISPKANLGCARLCNSFHFLICLDLGLDSVSDPETDSTEGIPSLSDNWRTNRENKQSVLPDSSCFSVHLALSSQFVALSNSMAAHD